MCQHGVAVPKPGVPRSPTTLTLTPDLSMDWCRRLSFLAAACVSATEGMAPHPASSSKTAAMARRIGVAVLN